MLPGQCLPGRESRQVSVTITSNDTIDDIAQKLRDAQLIRYPEVFKLYAKLAVDEGDILPGTTLEVTVENGELQRKKLGAIVFADEQALLDLNAITHGAIRAEIVRRLAQKPALAAIDAIALFEGGLAELCDTTVAISAPREDRIERLMQRDGISREYAVKRIDAQKPEGYFREKCAYVLENNGTAEQFREKCSGFLGELLK